jgi:peptidoglycan/xylan/chitin deacetylase (PgdA/CDA1 family)
MYHRFGGPAAADNLRRQCKHLRKHYRVVSFGELAKLLSGGGPLPEGSLAVTIDDGYRDFFQVAFPIFREYEIPAIVFLATGFLDRRCWLWTDQMRWSFARTTVREAEIEIGNAVRRFALDSPEARRAAYQQTTATAKSLPNPDRVKLLEQITRALRVVVPEQIPDEYAPLEWEEVKEARRGGMFFGAHTVTHPILSRLEKREEMVAEIVGSRERIEDALQEPVRHFCYPNGRPQDFEPEAILVVRETGFDAAVMAEPDGLNFQGANLFRLQRIGVTPDLPSIAFERSAAGFRLT